MGKVIPFPKIKLDREEQAELITDDISLELLILLEKYNIDTKQVQKLASLGCTNKEISEFFG